MNEHDLLDPLIGGLGLKGYPHHAAPMRRSALAAMQWNLLRGDMTWPLAVVKRDALAGNLRWMQQFARDQGLELAPHGKTTMSPQLIAAQLQAGAWGMTFANVTQARVGLVAGARRVLIANQVMAAADLGAVATLLRQHAGARVIFLVDSIAQLDLIEAWRLAQGEPAPAPFEVLLEIGLDGGRTGCRSHEQAAVLARRVRASAAARLVGIECYEGLWATGRSDDDRTLVQGLLQRVADVALLLRARRSLRMRRSAVQRGRFIDLRPGGAAAQAQLVACRCAACCARVVMSRTTTAATSATWRRWTRACPAATACMRRSRSGRWCSPAPSPGWPC